MPLVGLEHVQIEPGTPQRSAPQATFPIPVWPQETFGRDQNGNLVTSIVYVKVPAGKLAVTFANNLVTSLEQTEGSLEKAAQAKIVPAPFVVNY